MSKAREEYYKAISHFDGIEKYIVPYVHELEKQNGEMLDLLIQCLHMSSIQTVHKIIEEVLKDE